VGIPWREVHSELVVEPAVSGEHHPDPKAALAAAWRLVDAGGGFVTGMRFWFPSGSLSAYASIYAYPPEVSVQD
jgi:hypothetical protein